MNLTGLRSQDELPGAKRSRLPESQFLSGKLKFPEIRTGNLTGI
jgi:hypothetical protein